MRRITITKTGNGDERFVGLTGLLLQVYLEYGGGHTAATDVTLYRQVGANLHTLLTVTDSATSANYVPMVATVDSAGDAISGSYAYPAIDGDLLLRVAGGDAAGTVSAHLTILDDGPQQGRP